MTAIDNHSPAPNAKTVSGRFLRNRAIEVLQVSAVAFHGPLLWLAANARDRPDIGDGSVLSLGIAAIALLCLEAQALGGVDRRRGLATVSIGVVIFWNWQSLTLPVLGLPGWLSAGVLSATLVWASYLHGEKRLFRLAMFATLLTLAIVGLILIAMRIPRGQPHVVASPEITIDVTLDRRPDIYLLVLDGYARTDVLDEIYDFDNTTFEVDLLDAGFEVATRSTANYSITHLSLASLLDMGYPLESSAEVTSSDIKSLRTLLSGHNSFTRFLEGMGYDFVVGSATWWGTECSDTVDLCLPNPVLTRTSFELLAASPVGSLIYGREGDVGTALTLQRLRQIESWAPNGPEPDDGKPRFVFMHLPVPHPPLFLNSACQPRVDDRGEGRLMNGFPSIPEPFLDWRRIAYVQQVRCANLISRTLVETVAEDAVILIISDHGQAAAKWRGAGSRRGAG